MFRRQPDGERLETKQGPLRAANTVVRSHDTFSARPMVRLMVREPARGGGGASHLARSAWTLSGPPSFT